MRKQYEEYILSNESPETQQMLKLIFSEISSRNIGAEFLTNEIFSKLSKEAKISHTTILYLTTQTKLFELAKKEHNIDPFEDFLVLYLELIDSKIKHLYNEKLLSEADKNSYLAKANDEKAKIMFLTKFIDLGKGTKNEEERGLLYCLLLAIRHYQVVTEAK